MIVVLVVLGAVAGAVALRLRKGAHARTSEPSPSAPSAPLRNTAAMRRFNNRGGM